MNGAQLGALVPAIVSLVTAVGSLVGVVLHSKNASARIAKIEQVVGDAGNVALKDFGGSTANPQI
jgi:hypothetical protein